MILKLYAAAIIFIAALIGGLPSMWNSRTRRWQYFFFLSEYFARGIFLSAGLIHFLPDAADLYHTSHPTTAYPVTFLICAVTIFVIQLIEQTTAAFQNAQRSWLPYLLLVLLSIHSVIAGAALGVDYNLQHVLVIFIAIISHKTAESFALGISLHNHGIKKRIHFWLIVLFALMTPLSIIMAAAISTDIHSSQAIQAQSIFSAIAAGTFLYIAFLSNKKLEDDQPPYSTLIATLAFGCGIILMAAVACTL